MLVVCIKHIYCAILKVYKNMDEKKKLNFFDKFKNIQVNKNLITLKLTLFFLYGATSSLMPYLTIHMQSIGLTIKEIAIIYLALPFTTFLAPPITGFLVDKFGQYKPVIIVSFILNAAIHHSLLLIPHQETLGVVPSGYVMSHPNKEYVEVWWSPCPSRECPESEEIDVVLDMCVDHCLLLKQEHKVSKPNPPLPAEDIGDKDDLIFHLGKTNKNNTRKTGKTKRKSKKKKVFQNDTAVMFVLNMHADLAEPVENIGIELELDEDDTKMISFKNRFKKKLLKKSGVNVTELEEGDLRCGGVVEKTNSTYKNRLKEWSGDCIVQKCNFRDGGPEVCPPDFKESDDRTFWIYITLRFLGSVMLSAGITIMDPVALMMIEKYGGDFGREKLFSSFGMALFSPITGALIDQSSKRLGYTDYSAAFYTYDVLLLVGAFTVLLMPLGTKLPADNIFRDLLNIFKMPNVIVFILFLFVLGNLWGFIEGFLFFYLKDLGAPNYLLGITVTVGTVSSLPFLYGAEKITKKLGHINVIIIAFFAHAGRLMGYSFIESAWWCFPFEAMESLSVHLMWVAAATYCAILAPKHLLATLIGVIGMAHFSIGRGTGSFLGGHIISKAGIRQAFRFMGLVAVVSGALYAALYYAWLRKIEVKYDHDKTEDDEAGEADKLKTEKEPKYKDQGTMVSFERLSLMIEYNQIGSLTSLRRRSIRDNDTMTRARSNSIRRGSYSIGMFKTSRGSASKVDLLKSAIEVNHSKNYVHTFNPQINDTKTSSAPKLIQKSTSLGPIMDQEVDKTMIPDETEEIIYDTKLQAKQENTNTNDEKNCKS